MDTLREIYDRQLQQYQEHRRQQRERSYDYIKWYAEKHGWTEEQAREVVTMLGLEDETIWLTDIPRWTTASPLPKGGRPRKSKVASS